MKLPAPLSTCAAACFGVVTGDKPGDNGNKYKGNKWGFKSHVMARIRTAIRNELCIRANHNDAVKPKSHSAECPSMSHQHAMSSHPASSVISHDIHFASSGTCGIVDLVASQTVIGSQQMTELLQGLPEQIRKRAHRAPCQLVFRFGNHQTLTSKHALVPPLQKGWFRIAVVPGSIFTSAHLHIFSSSHLLIFTSSHLHICSSSHLLIFTFSHLHICSSSHLLIFTTSHLLIFTSSHLLIFTSAHLHIFISSHFDICSSSHLLIFTSAHLHNFSSTHLLIFTSSHFHICSSSHLLTSHLLTSHLLIFTSSHLLIFTSSHLHIFSSSHLLLIFTSSHLHIFTSAHLHIFSSSRLHILTPSHLLLLPSCPLALLPSCPLALLPSPTFLFLF